MRPAAQGFFAGSAFGIPIYVEASAIYFGPWLFLLALSQASGTDLVRAVAFFAIVIISVLIHELAHAIAARELGVPVRHIAITWFGGYAAFWVTPTHWRDAAIAFAGPASNLIIAAGLFMATANLPDPNTVEMSGSYLYIGGREPSFLEDVMRVGAYVNLALGTLNLLPGLPLDGGHILRAVLATRLSWGRAGWIAAWCGVIIGAAALVYAFWFESFNALFLGLFVSISAWFELRAGRHA